MSENLLGGQRFEYVVERKLREVFQDVKKHVKITGLSGSTWKIDFLIEDRLIVEASLQKRMDTKLTEIFMKFKDIKDIEQKCKCCFVAGVNNWFRDKLLDYLKTNHVLKTVKFARVLGVRTSKLSYLIHALDSEHVIKRVAKGTWILNKKELQTTLDMGNAEMSVSHGS